jgi:hypothetical protein
VLPSAAPETTAAMRRYRRKRNLLVNAIGGIWVFAAETAVVAAVVLAALTVAAVVLWIS